MKMHVQLVVALALCTVAGKVVANEIEDKLELVKKLERLEQELDAPSDENLLEIDDLADMQVRELDDDLDALDDFDDIEERGWESDLDQPDDIDDIEARREYDLDPLEDFADIGTEDDLETVDAITERGEGEEEDLDLLDDFADMEERGGEIEESITDEDLQEMGIQDIDELEKLATRGDLKIPEKIEAKLSIRRCRAKPGTFVKRSRCVWCKCFFGRYVRCINRCLLRPVCRTGRFSMSLDTRPRISARPNLAALGIQVVNRPSLNGNRAYRRQRCSKTALLKVNFQKLSRRETLLNQCGCTKAPSCGRKVLRIVMTLSRWTKRGHMFNIGDSKSNNGYNGDGGSQSNDAELHAVYPSATQWSNDYCEPKIKALDIFSKVLSPRATRVIVWISNEYIRVQNNVGFDQRMCHRCLWALNGQRDREGPVNQDIYLAFNRVIRSRRGRFGVGICRVDVSWYCPNCPYRRRPPFKLSVKPEIRPGKPLQQ